VRERFRTMTITTPAASVSPIPRLSDSTITAARCRDLAERSGFRVVLTAGMVDLVLVLPKSGIAFVEADRATAEWERVVEHVMASSRRHEEQQRRAAGDRKRIAATAALTAGVTADEFAQFAEVNR